MPILSTPPGAPKTATYITISAEPALTAERVLTGTSDQIIITDNGANSTVVLSTPQSINTTSSPTFVGLTLSGNETIAGYLRVGSNSAPTNTTAGDLTVVRLNIGNSAAFSGSVGEFVAATGTMTDTAGTYAYWFVNVNLTPASNQSAGASAQGINFIATTNPSAGVTMQTVTAGNFAIFAQSTGNITTMQGILANPMQTSASSPATVAATLAVAFVGAGPLRAGGTTTGTVTTIVNFDSSSLTLLGNSTWTVTTFTGYRYQSPTSTGNSITSNFGVDIEAVKVGTTNNTGIRIAPPSLINGINGTTDSIALKITTASSAMSNTTQTTTNAFGLFVGITTYTSTTNTRTLTNVASAYIAGAPVASTNITATNGPYALWVDADTSRFDGQLDLSAIAAGSPNMTITATSDTPTVVWSAIGTNPPSTTPAGYIEIVVGGNARYVPFWA